MTDNENQLIYKKKINKSKIILINNLILKIISIIINA